MLLLLIATVLHAQAPDRAMQMARMKRGVAEWLRTMPSYTCVVTLQRARLPRNVGEFVPTDQMRYDVAYSQGREFFSRDGKPFVPMAENQTTGGTISTGEFASHAKSVFVDGYSTMRFAEEVVLNGRPVLQWNFEIPEFGSGWTLHHLNGSTRVGSQGSFWVTPDELRLLRLQLNATGLPLQYSAAIATVEYGSVKLGGSKVMLPQTATLLLSQYTEVQNLNIMEFSHCRQFVAESTVSFSEASDGKGPSSRQLDFRPHSVCGWPCRTRLIFRRRRSAIQSR